MTVMSFVQVSGPPLNDEPRAGLVRMLCGVAGAGKTTYAKELEGRGFTRLSVDEEIWRRFGRFGVDYRRADYESHQEVAGNAVGDELVRLMRDRAPVVIDLSLWQRAARDRYKSLIVEHGCEWELVYLQVDEATLRARLLRRAERVDANAAFPISDAVLATFLDGFEAPAGEGEVVLRWEPSASNRAG
jgi:predicted kinase